MVKWLALLALATACRITDPFTCKTAADCRDDMMTGTCEITGFCSFMDPTCPSNSRYDASAGAGLGGTCVGGDPSDLDPDKDGVLTGVDNCPGKSNRDQHDEDGDGIGDACDPCPNIAGDAGSKDADGDGVGDACDPDPTTPGNAIVLFEGFATVPDWTTVDGALGAGATWTPGTDAVTGTNGAAFELPIAAPDKENITLGIHMLAGGSGRMLEVIDAYDSVAGTANGCIFGDPLVLASGKTDGNGTTVAQAMFPLAANGMYTITLGRNGSRYTCAVSSPLTNVGANITPPTGTKLALRTDSASVELMWVLVVVRP